MAYNLGCLPPIADIENRCKANGTVWACHSIPERICAGFAEMHSDSNRPLELIESIHYNE
jgi:hypothetical protein